MQELQKSQKAMLNSFAMVSPHDFDENSCKDWAIGSFKQFGDRPWEILGAKIHQGERLYLVDWKIRPDGFKPVKCFINEDELREADPLLLI